MNISHQETGCQLERVTVPDGAFERWRPRTLARELHLGQDLAGVVHDEFDVASPEFPLVANYGTPIRAFRSLRAEADTRRNPGLAVFTIGQSNSQEIIGSTSRAPLAAIGLARARRHTTGDFAGWTELSYWHSRRHDMLVNHLVGNKVLAQLIEQGIPAVASPEESEPDEGVFMLAPANDRLKVFVLPDAGFEPKGHPQQYDVDGVVASRQLWVQAA